MAREKKKYHYIYKTTNLLNGKYYIGMHSTSNLDDGYMGSGKRLRYSINKHGVKNHKVEILESFNCREELVKREEEVVNLNEIANEKCMNLRIGGSGGFTVEQQRLNAKKSNERQKFLMETDSNWVNKKNTACSENQKKNYDDGIREKYYFYDWVGKKHSEDAKKNMSNAKKGKCDGDKNSQYGTCWITNGSEEKKIRKDQLEIYILEKWYKGRKIQLHVPRLATETPNLGG